MQIIYIQPAELKPYHDNPRKNDRAADAVAASIQEFGFKVPIVIDKDYEIIAGHTRLKAAIKLGLTEVPCIIADDLTPEQIKAFRLADNKTAELAEWDFDLLELELSGIELDMSVFGFESALPDGEVQDDDYDIQPPDEPVSKQGETYRLGNHYLHCGDATSDKALARLMGGGCCGHATHRPTV